MKSKRFLSFVLAVLMVISAIPATVVTFSAANESVAQTGFTGSGTEKDPYIINTANDLYSLFHSDKNMHVKLGQDISLTSSVYVESDITLDMNGKTITADVKSYGFNITKGHSLKIKGSGKFLQKGTQLWAMFCVEGTLETHGTVTYECPDNSGCPINLSGYGIVRVYGGNFLGDQIAINGGSKMLVYGGNIASDVLVTKATQLYVYDGTFESRIYNYGYLYTFGGEFKKDVSSLGEYGEAIFWGGHFKEGVSNYSTSETGGIHILGQNAICMAHNSNDVTDDGIFVYTEITVFRPDYKEQTPEIKYNETEYDLGTINSLEDFIISFKAKDLPKVFADNGYTIEEKLVVKDSDGFVETYDIKSGTKGQGVKLNLGNLTGGDYTVERTINLYKGSSLKKSNKCIMKVTVNPMSSGSFGFATMNPAVSAEDMKDNYTDLPATAIGTQTLNFGFTPFISTALSDKGFSVKSKVYINYNNQGTIKTLNSGKTFNLMDYVERIGDYQVWFNISLYNGDEFVTSKTHIYNIPIVLYDVNTLKANVTAPVAGALPDNTVTPAGEGYDTTDVDWSYYDERYEDYYIMPDGMTFEAGKTYECAVRFDALDEYTFPENKADIKGFINGYQGIVSSVYSEDRAYVTVRFTVAEVNNLEVIFTTDSKAQEGKFLEVDLEKMAELSDEFMEAYLNDYVKCQWFLNGSKIDDATNVRFDIPEGYADNSLYVEVFYGDNSLESDNLVIEKGAVVAGILGDADCDGKVNIKDATAIQKHVAGLITLTKTGEILADVDSNTTVNIKDATAIQKHIAGMDTGFDIGKEI